MSIVTGGVCPVPLQIPGAMVWYDAADPLGNGTALADNDAVSSWKDKSGNGRHLVQGSVMSQPINKTGIVGALPALLFDGVNDCMVTTDLTLPTTMTAACAFLPTGINGSEMLATVTNSGGRYQIIRYDNFLGPTQGNLATYNGAAINNTINITAGSKYIIFTQNGTAGQFYINGQTVSAGSVFNTSYHFSQVGALDSTFQNCFTGYYFEALIYSRVLSADELTTLETYFANKWGISL